MAIFFLNMVKCVCSCIILALPMNDKEKNRLTVQTNIDINRIKPPIWQIFSTTFHDTYQWSVSATLRQNPLSWNILIFDQIIMGIFQFMPLKSQYLKREHHISKARKYFVIYNATENRPSVLKHSHIHCRYCTIVINMSRGRLT